MPAQGSGGARRGRTSASSAARSVASARAAGDRLVVRGAREHNLKNVSVDLPRDSLVVFTGLSGSGKSSLAFDTIFAEGQRRYVESLSAYARQFLGQMDKPDVDFIEGLSPAVSIDQKSTSRNPRSTVGTITEVYDYLRLLFARAGTPHCPVCGEPVGRQTPQQIVDQLLEMPDGTRFQLLAPVVRERKGEYAELFRELQAKGFARARVDGEVVPLDNPPTLQKRLKHTIEVVVDRLVVKDGVKRRLTDSVETALLLSSGLLVADLVDVEGPEGERRFSEKMACPNEHPLELDEIEPRSFSFNSPFGACPECTGIGTQLEVDPELVVPDEDLSLAEGAIAPWTAGSADYFERLVTALAADLSFSTTTPWRALPKRAKDALLYGKDHQVHVRYKNRWGRERSYSTGFEGVVEFVKRRHAETESDSSKERYEGYMRETPCPVCQGARLKPTSLAVKIAGRSISTSAPCRSTSARASSTRWSCPRGPRRSRARCSRRSRRGSGSCSTSAWTTCPCRGPRAPCPAGGPAHPARDPDRLGAGGRAVRAGRAVDRPAPARQPPAHRHPHAAAGPREHPHRRRARRGHRAHRRLDRGLRSRRGERGGEVVHSGDLEGLLTNPKSLTGQYLSGARAIEVPAQRRPQDGRKLVVTGARQNNLKDVTVEFPLGQLVAVTGVSGSGKSTLVNDILYTVLANKLNGARRVPGRHKSVEGLEHLDKVVHVDQSPIGRTPRSNPATYTGVFDHIRKLFASAPESKLRGYQPGRFSFNIKGGRCEACAGDGTLKIEMNFLPDVYVPCEVCHGARYNRETLEVHFKGKTIAEVLDMPIEEAADFFAAVPAISRFMTTLTEVGLGYVRLGQPATTLSGGGPAREAGLGAAAALQRPHGLRPRRAHDGSALRGHPQAARRGPGPGRQGQQRAGHRAQPRRHQVRGLARRHGARGRQRRGDGRVHRHPEEVAADPASYTGQFLAEILQTTTATAGTRRRRARAS